MSQQDEQVNFNKPTLWATVVLISCLLAAALTLALWARWEAGAILGFLAGLAGVAAPLVLLLDRSVNIHRINTDQTTRIQRIEHQTNGELQTRVETAVTRALERATGTAGPAAPIPNDEPPEAPSGLQGS